MIATECLKNRKTEKERARRRERIQKLNTHFGAVACHGENRRGILVVYILTSIPNVSIFTSNMNAFANENWRRKPKENQEKTKTKLY